MREFDHRGHREHGVRQGEGSQGGTGSTAGLQVSGFCAVGVVALGEDW
jgi:hypothetical protein